MEFPIEEVKDIFSIAKSTAEVIIRLFRQYNNDEGGENGDRKDCIKRAILILRQETQSQKRAHVEKFVENTILAPECVLEPSTIFSFLEDIEQMTWRQFCLLEGFRRNGSGGFKIKGVDNKGINGRNRETEIKKMIDLKYLGRGSDDIYSFTSTSFDHIGVSELGHEIAHLLGLHSVEFSEIGKAFGRGMIEQTVTNSY